MRSNLTSVSRHLPNRHSEERGSEAISPGEAGVPRPAAVYCCAYPAGPAGILRRLSSPSTVSWPVHAYAPAVMLRRSRSAAIASPREAHPPKAVWCFAGPGAGSAVECFARDPSLPLRVTVIGVLAIGQDTLVRLPSVSEDSVPLDTVRSVAIAPYVGAGDCHREPSVCLRTTWSNHSTSVGCVFEGYRCSAHIQRVTLLDHHVNNQ